MSSRDRAQWQAAAARVRALRAKYRRPGWATRTDAKFTHGCLLRFSREGVPFDPYWWA